MLNGKFSDRSRNIRRALARRKVYAGYPVDARNFSADEVRAYLGGDKITCLLCGKSFKRISANHLHKIHGVVENDYREMYGLPYRVGLASASSRSNYSSAVCKRLEYDTALAATLEAGRSALHQQREGRHMRKPPYALIEARARFDTMNAKRKGGVIRDWCDEDAEDILSQIMGGRTAREVLAEPGRPKASWWRDYIRKNPDFSQRVAAAIDALPFSKRARMAGPRLEREVRRLFDKGLSDHKIAKALGISAMTCNRQYTKAWRAAIRSPASDKAEG